MDFSNTAFEFSRVFNNETNAVKPAYEAFMNSQYGEKQADERRKASLVVSTLLERWQQMKNMDPFLLLKEVNETFKVDEPARRQPEFAQSHEAGFSVKNKDLFYQAQMKPKQTDWFAKMQGTKHAMQSEPAGFPSLEKLKKEPIKTNRFGLTKEDEIQIGLEMIPMFQAKEEELI